MRRSLTIQLTILPLLASAALAHADAPGDLELAPPGMAPVVQVRDCYQDPDEPWCPVPAHGHIVGIVRGGFGHYFWAGGG